MTVERHAPIVHGNTTYSQDMYRLLVNGKAVRLTSMEIKLLKIMLDRFDTVLRKLTVYDALYGHQTVPPHPTALNSMMCRLRRKLTDAGSDLNLRSVPGRGIVLAANAGVSGERSA